MFACLISTITPAQLGLSSCSSFMPPSNFSPPFCSLFLPSLPPPCLAIFLSRFHTASPFLPSLPLFFTFFSLPFFLSPPTHTTHTHTHTHLPSLFYLCHFSHSDHPFLSDSSDWRMKSLITGQETDGRCQRGAMSLKSRRAEGSLERETTLKVENSRVRRHSFITGTTRTHLK